MGWRELLEAITQPVCEELGPEFCPILSSCHPSPDNKEPVSGMAWLGRGWGRSGVRAGGVPTFVDSGWRWKIEMPHDKGETAKTPNPTS